VTQNTFYPFRTIQQALLARDPLPVLVEGGVNLSQALPKLPKKDML